MNLKQKFEILQKNFNLMAKSKLSLQEFGPVSSFSTSILSGLMIGLAIQYFIGYEPFPVVIFVLVGIYAVSYTQLTLPTLCSVKISVVAV